MIKNKQTLRKLDLVFSVVLFAFSLFFFVNALKMPRENLGSFGGNSVATAPGILPAIISGILMLLAVLLFVSAYKENARITREDLLKALAAVKSRQSLRIALVVLIVIVYAFLLLGNIPYSLATAVYLFVFMLVFKADKIWKLALISVITALCIWAFFGQVAMIPLP